MNVRKLTGMWILVLIVSFSQRGIAEQSDYLNRHQLSIDEAANLLKLPLSCAEIEYPNKLSQMLRGDEDLASPKSLHPAFYGCFDWHSAVHGHWSMVRLLKAFPSVEGNTEAKAILMRHITPANIAVDVAYVKSDPSWERLYGWAWLLKLTQELETWNDPIANSLAETLKPLAKELSSLYINYLPKLVYPIRVGEHTNTAFGLTFAWDYAQQIGDTDLSDAISKRAIEFYQQDKSCPIKWEPSGYDFLSPCLEEIDLMRRVLPKSEFLDWLKEFMPSLLSPDFNLEVGEVLDRSDGKLVHLDGLNFSRAWVLSALAKEYSQLGHLQVVADKHLAYSLPNLVDDSYEGGHWLGSFAIYALLP